MTPYKFPRYSAHNRINMRVPITAAASPGVLILRGTQDDPLSRSVVTEEEEEGEENDDDDRDGDDDERAREGVQFCGNAF